MAGSSGAPYRAGSRVAAKKWARHSFWPSPPSPRPAGTASAAMVAVVGASRVGLLGWRVTCVRRAADANGSARGARCCAGVRENRVAGWIHTCALHHVPRMHERVAACVPMTSRADAPFADAGRRAVRRRLWRRQPAAAVAKGRPWSCACARGVRRGCTLVGFSCPRHPARAGRRPHAPGARAPGPGVSSSSRRRDAAPRGTVAPAVPASSAAHAVSDSTDALRGPSALFHVPVGPSGCRLPAGRRDAQLAPRCGRRICAPVGTLSAPFLSLRLAAAARGG